MKTHVAALFAALFISGLAVAEDHTIKLESPALKAGERIPADYTADGNDASLPLKWSGAPKGTTEFALIFDDPDAPTPKPWVHWIIYNIPASARGLPEGIPIDRADAMPAGLEGTTQGNNSWNLAMYRGPAPPAGTVHDYDFTVLALNAELNLPSGLTRAEVLEAIEGHVIGEGNMVPTYTRQPAEAGATFE